MTTNADASILSQPSPCDGCASRRVCADLREPKACTAYEAFEDGQPAIMWRDAPRIPLTSIGRRLLIRWHGTDKVNELYPLTRK